MHNLAKFRQYRLNRGRDKAIFRFFKMAAAASWILKFQFLTVGTVKRVKLHHRAKFHQNRSNRGRNVAIFPFLKMAAAAILDFRNFKFLTVGTVKRVELRHHGKFRRNRSKRGRDMSVLISVSYTHLTLPTIYSV